MISNKITAFSDMFRTKPLTLFDSLIENEKPHLYYEGDAPVSDVKHMLNEWYFSDNNIPNIVKKVDKIEVNHLNKLVRTQEFA